MVWWQQNPSNMRPPVQVKGTFVPSSILQKEFNVLNPRLFGMAMYTFSLLIIFYVIYQRTPSMIFVQCSAHWIFIYISLRFFRSTIDLGIQWNLPLISRMILYKQILTWSPSDILLVRTSKYKIHSWLVVIGHLLTDV